MNCDDARQVVLDSLTGPIRAELYVLIETHIASCDACRQFADVQRALDVRLTAAVPVVSLSSGFRSSLRQRINSRQISIWPEFLPDVAHLIGCILGVVLLLLLFPGYSKTVLLAGASFTAVTYFFQAVLRNALERLEPRL